MLPLVLASCQPDRPPHLPDPYDTPQVGRSVMLDGVVSSVERPRPGDSRTYVHLLFTVGENKPLKLVLAPGWYLDQQGLRLAPNDSLRVEGKQIAEKGGGESVVVRRIQRGDQQFELRDAHEQPKWESAP